jgi:hypothetical protein
MTLFLAVLGIAIRRHALDRRADIRLDHRARRLAKDFETSISSSQARFMLSLA